ncbi:hypothetical protein B5G52_14805 [Pseudoalteromonas sp. A601]|uniref:hypothetical protein n=1 Tax=Pseudoalteromonas sp. A601 TaxID=1967839 RepID=UPI000B3CB21E|nr:hypothetical protein [Pseudoalteromonas sp. A601]OUS70359.1 hypothetical protein B5G52_14805 [Pseudoalteromonas sp. A601]
MFCYYLVFFIALAYTFKQGASKASYSILTALALLTACLPISSIIQGMNNVALLPYYEGYMVDITATLFAFVFAKMAKYLKYKPAKNKVIVDTKKLELIN